MLPHLSQKHCFRKTLFINSAALNNPVPLAAPQAHKSVPASGTCSCETSAPERTSYIVAIHLIIEYSEIILAIHTWHLWDNVVPLAPRQAPKSVPATLLLYTYLGILTNLSRLGSKMTHVSQCGTPSCETSAQERTGYSCPQLRAPAPRSTAMSELGTRNGTQKAWHLGI